MRLQYSKGGREDGFLALALRMVKGRQQSRAAHNCSARREDLRDRRLTQKRVSIIGA